MSRRADVLVVLGRELARERFVDCMATLILLLGACSQTIPESVEGCHAYGEAHFDTEAPPGWTPDYVSPEMLLFVVEKPLRPLVEHIIREAVESFARPNYGDAWLNDFVMKSKKTRVFVVDRTELAQVLPALACFSREACPSVELPSAELYSPGYNFGTTNEDFDAQLSCLLSGDESCYSQSGVSARLVRGADIVWISDQDSCAEPGDGCDAFQQLLALQTELFLVVPLPLDLADTHQPSGAIGALPSQVLAALQADGVASECAETYPDAHAPRALFEAAYAARGDDGIDIFALPLCGANSGSVLTRSIADRKTWDVFSFFPYFSCSESFLNLVPGEDGLVPCTLTETLPSVGPITHCSQLADRGRELFNVSTQTGRETCLIQQLPLSGSMVLGGQGYAHAALAHSEAEAMGLKQVCGFYQSSATFWVANEFTTIPGSSSHMVCTTVDETSSAYHAKQGGGS